MMIACVWICVYVCWGCISACVWTKAEEYISFLWGNKVIPDKLMWIERASLTQGGCLVSDLKDLHSSVPWAQSFQGEVSKSLPIFINCLYDASMYLKFRTPSLTQQE